jgi:predicted alpha/beta-hydrolase family hydrolase
MAADPQRLSIAVSPAVVVSALLLVPDKPKACFALAHGAGAGMTHRFMVEAAAGLHERGVATLRYQFPYMEKGSRRPDAPALAHATVRAAVKEAKECLPDTPLFAGGKSFGGAHDLASTGGGAAAERARARFSRLPAASRQQTFDGTSPSPV